MSGGRRGGRARRGQALVEFALVLPLLLMLVIGVFEFGRAYNVYQVITDAAREGARTAVVADPSTTQDSVLTTIRNALGRAGLNSSSATIGLTGWRTGTGTPATVTIQFPYTFVFLRPFTRLAPITLQTAFSMRNE
jgi:Flp pilus assembly protein TadG